MSKIKLAIVAAIAVIGLHFTTELVSYLFGSATKRLHADLVGQVEKYKQLSEHAAKLEVRYVEEQKLREELERRFAREKDELEGRVKLLSNATFLIRESARRAGHSDLVYQGASLKYVVNEIRFQNGPPVGYVLIFDDGRVVSKLYNHVIDVATAVARDESTGRYSVVSKADFILKSPSINVNGEQVWTNRPFPLKIIGGTAVVDPTERNQLAPRLHIWALHVNLGASIGADLADVFIRPTLDFSLAGYGVTKNDLQWKFVHAGLDVDTQLSNFGLHFTPASYRFWPELFSNSYVGPSIGWTRNGINIQLNLNLTL